MKRSIVFPLALLCASFAGAPLAAAVPIPAVPPLRLPEPVSRTLPNGLRVVVFPSSSLPIVQAQLLVPAGIADEPDSLPGLAALTARVVQMGSASRTTEQLSADLGAIGATFNTGAMRDFALTACGGRSSVFEAALEIMADVVLSPRLGDAEFDAARSVAVQQFRSRSPREGLLADDRLWGIAFDPHPYGHPERGELEALLATDLDHVKGFVRDRWRPDRAVLAIAGDVSPERAFAAAGDAFGRWAGSVSADRARLAPAAAPGVYLLNLAGSARAEVRVAVRGPGRASPELAAWLVTAAALEDRLAGTAASVSFNPLRDASLLVLAESAPADSARDVADRLLGTLRDVASAPPAGEAAKAARHRVARSLPLTLETIGAQLSRWQADDFAGLPAGAIRRLLAALDAPALDLSPTSRALASAPTIFAAGPGEKLGPLLASLGPVTRVPLSIRRSSRPDSLAPPTDAELRAGKAAIETAVAAHGGAARLAAAKSQVNEGDMALEARGQKFEGQFSFVRIEPSQFSQSTKMMTFEVRQVLDGDTGWMLASGDSAALSEAEPDEIRSMRAAFHSDLVHLLRAASAAGSGAAKRGSETIGGTACDLVDFTGHDGQRLRLAIDRATKRVLAADAGLGADVRWHERRLFSEWKTVLGLALPAFEERFIDGERVNYFRSRVITVNPVLDESLFKKPMVVRGQLIPGR